MNAQKVSVKLFATERLAASLESYIPVFHRWIRNSQLEELLIDVADYTHVPRGIGVLLVGHGSDLAIDQGEDRPGVMFSRKRALPSGAALVTDALRRTLEAAAFIDQDPEVHGPKSFSSAEVLFRFPDRLHLTNDDASLEVIRPAIEAAFSELLPGQSYALSREGERREPLTVRARAS
jgi:hypothetical protein